MRVPNVYISIFLTTVCLVAATENEKRAPSGFTGVRGKKSISEHTYGDMILNENEEDDPMDVGNKRAPSGFMGMRGKKPFEGWVPEDDIQPEEPIYLGVKRKPSGFHGMRGKKDLDFGEEYSKRAPNGFFGMRGKKEYDSDSVYGKRAPSGFMGMRGKKDYENLDENKRAPNSGFFGMRGKKQPARSSGFYGTRGKKYPYEFRGKFVGVRGKKMSNEVHQPEYYGNKEFARLEQGLDMNQLMLLLTENDEVDQAAAVASDSNGQTFQN